jgi:phosphate-selective porin
VERELREENVWRDAFVNFTYLDDFQLQAGKFKIPFSQEQLTSPTDLDFVYRSQLVDNLSPARSVGVVLHGRFQRRAIGYDAGVFRQDGENARFGFNPGAERTIAGRFAVRPLRLTSIPGASREMEVAFAITAADVPDGLNSLRGRTAFRVPFFEPVYVKGQRVRLGVDADWRPGPFSVKAEFIRVTDERKNQGLFDEDLPSLVAQGWYVSSTWVMTGEPKFEGLEPRRPLFRGGAGAVELAARFERLGFGSSLEGEPEFNHPRSANLLEASDRVWTFGINWYVNRWVKLQGNAIREWVDNTNSLTIQNRTPFWTYVGRLQFVI